MAIKLLKTTLTKVCAGQHTNKDWDLCLPLAVSSINQSNPRGAPLSRQKLYYSPFIYDQQPLMLENPVKTQTQSYQYLNQQRIKALQSSKHKKHDQLTSVKGMTKGMYVKLDSKIGNKSINICTSLDIYKITQISNCKMAVTLLNLRTNSIQTVSPDRIELLNGGDLISLHNNSDVFDIMARANRLR